MSVLALLCLTAGWLLFAVLFHEDTLANDMDGIAGAMPGKPTVRRVAGRGSRPFASPAPAVRPVMKSAAARAAAARARCARTRLTRTNPAQPPRRAPLRAVAR